MDPTSCCFQHSKFWILIPWRGTNSEPGRCELTENSSSHLLWVGRRAKRPPDPPSRHEDTLCGKSDFSPWNIACGQVIQRRTLVPPHSGLISTIHNYSKTQEKMWTQVDVSNRGLCRCCCFGGEKVKRNQSRTKWVVFCHYRKAIITTWNQ